MVLPPLIYYYFMERIMTEKKKPGRPKKIKVEEAVDFSVEIPADGLPIEAAPVTEEQSSGKISIDVDDYAEFQELKRKEVAARKAFELKKIDYEYYADFDKGSSVPAWALNKQTEMLEDEVNSLDTQIEMGGVPSDEIYLAKETLNMKKDRLRQIKDSKPKLTGTQLDTLVEKRNKLAEEIRESKFTEYQMEKGLADPHEEARRMTEPVINVDKEEARRMGIDTINGKVSRNKAESMWKNMSSLIGDTQNNPNSEMLRDTMGTGGRKRSQVSIGADAWDKVFKDKEPVGV